MRLETLTVHTGRPVEPDTGAVTPPIILSTTFERAEDGNFRQDIYTRLGNPNRSALETALAALEGGTAALAFASGQAAAAAMLHALKTGDHVVLSDDLYHGVRHYAKDVMSRWGLQFDFVDMREAINVKRALRSNTRLVWVETPSNPSLKIVNIAAIAELAHQVGALCLVDNSWATPVFQRPFQFGADVVLHSTTKYIGGHSDVLGGALILRNESSGLEERLRAIQTVGGGVPSPFDCWLLLRSLPTLPIRVREQAASAEKIAFYLSEHPRIEVVHYPGLPTHAGYEVAKVQMSRFGGMLSFQIKGGQAEAIAFTERLKIFTRATSLGGVESLIEHRASIEGADSPTPPNLLRASIGLEHVDDLIDDLAQALAM
jgi:cystathionine gamma-synthase